MWKTLYIKFSGAFRISQLGNIAERVRILEICKQRVETVHYHCWEEGIFGIKEKRNEEDEWKSLDQQELDTQAEECRPHT